MNSRSKTKQEVDFVCFKKTFNVLLLCLILYGLIVNHEL